MLPRTYGEVLAKEFATAGGADGRVTGETCPVLPVTASGRTSETAAIRSDAGADRAIVRRDRTGEVAPKSVSKSMTASRIFARSRRKSGATR